MGRRGAEWARRSMVVTFFQENIGGDRFWQLVDDMLRVIVGGGADGIFGALALFLGVMRLDRALEPPDRGGVLPGEYRRRPFLAAGR
jgi:hypothetical protein